MSKFDPLLAQLERYNTFAFHQDAQLAQRLHDVQEWQKERIKYTHQALFAVPEHALMTQYFLNRLYGGPDFDVLAHHILRIIKHSNLVEKVIPNSAIQIGLAGVSLAVLAMQLDEALAADLLNHYPAHQVLTDEIMSACYVRQDQHDARLHQMDLLDELSVGLDKYLRSALVKSAFKMAKGLAHKYRIDPLYDFIGEGFDAMKPMKSAQDFVQNFTSKEREIIEKVHAGVSDPFDRSAASANT